MALKDWKKRINPNYYFVFDNKNSDQSITLDNTQHGMFKAINKYYLEIFNTRPYKKVLSKLFKTKSQALRFARAYMRKH